MSSLVFHEMFHWTESTHFPKKYPDIVYLSQFCCFPQEDHNEEDREFSCEVLEEERAWQIDESHRLEFIKENDIQRKVKDLISKYH